MSKFDDTMLEIHEEAKKLAFEDAEKRLFLEGNIDGLKKLKEIRKNDYT